MAKKMWCVAELDEKYIESLEDVLALYAKSYHAAEPILYHCRFDGLSP